ncbi:MAG: hypothetical protein K8S16_05665 [Bacteroidales bacterium]|nr:hypothetical protein [Bacteroidales bacterium]
MNRFLLATLLFLFAVIISYSQEPETNRKTWQDGKLTWDDFRGKPYYNLSQESGFEYIFGYINEKHKQNDTIILRLKAYAWFLMDESWVLPSAKSDIHLQYNQVIFNMVEVQRRKFQNAMINAKSNIEADELFHIYLKKLNQGIEDFEYESSAGNKYYIIQRKQEEIKRELSSLKEKLTPDFKRGNFGYGFFAGFGWSFFSGTLGEHFRSAPNFSFGFDFAYKKAFFFLDGSLGGSKVIKDYEDKNYWEKGVRSGLAIINLGLGYSVHDGHRLKIVPYAAYSVFELSNNQAPEEERSDFVLVDDLNLSFGINLDYKLRQKFRLLPGFGMDTRDYTETNVRFRVSVVPVNIYPDLKGYSINFMIGMDVFGNQIKFL